MSASYYKKGTHYVSVRQSILRHLLESELFAGHCFFSSLSTYRVALTTLYAEILENRAILYLLRDDDLLRQLTDQVLFDSIYLTSHK